MTSSVRVDFYLLQQAEINASYLLACRLLEKAYLKGHQVYVYCQDLREAEHLDELLWTFREDSFIPHHLQGEGPTPPPPVQLGYQSEPRGFHDILLNFHHEVPSFYKRFKRVIEIVHQDEARKALSRAHYRVYRAHGCNINTHDIQEHV